MRQSFIVITPASNLSLVAIEQLRKAAGLTADDDSRDDDLRALGDAIATDIAVACGVSDDGIHPPTLLAETIAETLWNGSRGEEIFTSRRFVTNIAGLTECSSVLDNTGYVLDAGAGIIRRVNGGRPYCWATGTLTITYTAGFVTAPPDLQQAVVDLARMRLSAASRDPLVKSESIEVPDIETRRQDYWVGALPGTDVAPVPPDILARLARYQNVVIAC